MSQQGLHWRVSPRIPLAGSQRGLHWRVSLRFPLVVDVEKVHPRRSHLSVAPSGIFLHSSTYLTLTSGAFVPKSMFPLSKVQQMPNEPLVFSVNGLCHSFTPAATATLLFRNTNVSDWIVSEIETERQTCGVQGAGEGCHCVLGKRDSAAGERDDAVRGELHCAVFLRIGDIRGLSRQERWASEGRT